MYKRRILWIDDEIEMLKPFIIFLEKKDYIVDTATNGDDGISMVKENYYDLILLDEMMPGKDGISTLKEIKLINPSIPIVMATKSEQEDLMEKAIAKNISDYIIKPLNPNQILITCKKILEKQNIKSSRLAESYVQDVSIIRQLLFNNPNHNDWIEIHKKLSYWDNELDNFDDESLKVSHYELRETTNADFAHFIEKNYIDWVNTEEPDPNMPDMSHTIFKKYLADELRDDKQIFFIVLDCMSLDQWFSIENLLYDYFNLSINYYYSILPTATPYSRNSIFSGLLPLDISDLYPEFWWNHKTHPASRNKYEPKFMAEQLRRNEIRLKNGFKYMKIYDKDVAREVAQNMDDLFDASFTALVFNFIDFLVHSRSESDILQEIAPDSAGFRSLTKTWFKHSALLNILKQIAEKNITVYLTTDHGSLFAKKPTLVHGNKSTSTNIRYKFGTNLNVNEKHALKISNPLQYKLPKESSSFNYLIAKEYYFFVYPNEQDYYEKQFKGSLVHGGISLEEMILPIIKLIPKS